MRMKAAIFVLATLLSTSSFAALEVERLEESITVLRTYTYGNAQGIDLNWVEQQIGLASGDAAIRARVEDALIASLEEAESDDAKQFLCRQLVTVGTARCVPVLAAMLTDAEMSHMARYALGRIEVPEAGAALHDALNRTSGKTKAGIINSLVEADYAEAAADILKLIDDSDSDVAVAAIKGAGHLGGADAVSALRALRSSAATDLQVEIDAAILARADRLARDSDEAAAKEIYGGYYAGEYGTHLRIAGLRGLVALSGVKANRILLKAIQGDDTDIRSDAVMQLASIEGPETAESFIELLDVVPAEVQELIVRSLATRGDVSAVSSIMQLTTSDDEYVRRASIEALGDIGGAESIPWLAEAAVSAKGQEKEIALASLTRMRGIGVPEAFIELAQSGEPDSRLEVIRAIGLRVDHEPFETLYRLAKEDELKDIRREAIASMGRIGLPKDLDELVGLVVAPKHPEDRGTVLRSIGSMFNRVHDARAQAEPILAALNDASEEATISLLGLLSTPATREALEAVGAAVESSNSEVSDAAIRTLGKWPNPAPVEQLYTIAAESDNESHKLLALRGYIRLAPLTPGPHCGLCQRAGVGGTRR